MIAGGSVAVVLSACLCTAVSALPHALSPTVPGSTVKTLTRTSWPGEPRVYWAGGGRYLVVQGVVGPHGVASAGATPVVGVWDSRTGRTASHVGYRLVAVEPASARAWVVEDGPTSVARFIEPRDPAWPSPATDQAGDPFDMPADALLQWSLDSPEDEPDRPGAYRWATWRGPGRTTVDAFVDPARGSDPCTLTFETPGRPAAGFALAEDHRTFEPIGWSPSGRYFAVVSLISPGSVQDDLDQPSSAYYSTRPAVIVIDALTGSVAAERDLDGAVVRGVDLRRWVTWQAGEDELLCQVVTEDPNIRGRYRFVHNVYALSRSHPDGRSLYCENLDTEADWEKAPWPFGEDAFFFLGSTEATTYAATGQGPKEWSLWAMDPTGASAEGTLAAPLDSSALSPDGRLATIGATSGRLGGTVAFVRRFQVAGSKDATAVWRAAAP